MIVHDLEEKVELLGPIPAEMERKSGYYRYQLLFQSKYRKHLHSVLNKLVVLIENQPIKVRWSLDVDPQEIV